MSELLNKLGLNKKDSPRKLSTSVNKAPETPADIFGEKLVTAEELAEVLRITPSALKKRVSRKQIPFIRIGLCVRFRPSKIAQWLSNNGNGELECIDIPTVPDYRTDKRREAAEARKSAKAALPVKKSKGGGNRRKSKKGRKK